MPEVLDLAAPEHIADDLVEGGTGAGCEGKDYLELVHGPHPDLGLGEEHLEIQGRHVLKELDVEPVRSKSDLALPASALASLRFLLEAEDEDDLAENGVVVSLLE
jgi:hypothetical protein